MKLRYVMAAGVFQLVLSSSGFGVAQESHGSFEELNAAGIRSVRERNYEAAEVAFKTALTALPVEDKERRSTVLHNLSVVYESMGRKEEAADCLKQEQELTGKPAATDIVPKPKPVEPTRSLSKSFAMPTMDMGIASTSSEYQELNKFCRLQYDLNRRADSRCDGHTVQSVNVYKKPGNTYKVNMMVSYMAYTAPAKFSDALAAREGKGIFSGALIYFVQRQSDKTLKVTNIDASGVHCLGAAL